MIIKKRERTYDGYFKIDKLTVEQAGKTFEREQFSRGNAVAALVFDTTDKKYILTKQYRIGSESELVEVVAGMVDEGEQPEESIRREVEEEIGYRIERLERLHTFYSSPGGSTEQVVLFYAEVSHRHSLGGGNEHENEFIEIVKFTPNELTRIVSEDAKTIIALQWVLLQNK